MDERGFWKLLSEQAGVGSVWQAAELGIEAHHLRTLIKRGSLRRVCYGIVAAAGAPDTPRMRCHLGLLLAGPRRREPGIRSALCRWTAAARFDMIEPLPESHPIHVLTTRRVPEREGFLFHWTSRLPEDELVTVDGLTLTDPLRTYFDMCEAQPHRSLSIYRRSLRKGIFDEAEALRRLDREARQGRRGVVVARRTIQSTSPDAFRALSAREDHYFDLLVEAGYPPPVRNAKVPGSFGYDWQIDLFYPQRNFGLEVSPVVHHSDPEVVMRDQRKIGDLTAAGIDILPVGDDLSDRDCLRLVRKILGPPEDFPCQAVDS